MFLTIYYNPYRLSIGKRFYWPETYLRHVNKYIPLPECSFKVCFVKIANQMTGEKLKLKQTLARNLKKHRAELGITQEKAAERAELTLKYWQRLEMVSQPDLPSLPALVKIAKALDIKIHQLFL